MPAVIRRVFPKTIPVLAGYVFLGFAYGVAMRVRGLGALWSGLCSVLIYGGSMQFAMIDALTAAFQPLTIAALTLLIQARHLFYGLSMLSYYAPGEVGRFRPYLIYALTDETYSLVCNGAPLSETDKGRWYAAISLLDESYWVAGSLLGGVLGSLLPTEGLTGIDFSMTALFTVIVTEQSMDAYRQVRAGTLSLTDALFSPLLGAAATMLSLIALGTGSFLLLSMGLMLAGFYLRYRWEERGGARP